VFDTEGDPIPMSFTARLKDENGEETVFEFSLKAMRQVSMAKGADAELSSALAAVSVNASTPSEADAQNEADSAGAGSKGGQVLVEFKEDEKLAQELQAQEARQYAKARRASMQRLKKQAEADREYAEKLQKMMDEEEQEEQEEEAHEEAESLAAADVQRVSRPRALTDNPTDSESSESSEDETTEEERRQAEEEARRRREIEEKRLQRDRVRMAGELDKQHRNMSWESRYFVLQGEHLHYYSLVGVVAAVRRNSPSAHGKPFEHANHGALLGQYDLDNLFRVKHKKQDGGRRFKLYFGANKDKVIANGRQTVRLRAATADSAVEWVTQISNALSDRDFDARAAKAAKAQQAAVARAASAPKIDDGADSPKQKTPKAKEVCQVSRMFTLFRRDESVLSC